VWCFSGWEADFGRPLGWYRNPVSGARWTPSLDASVALRETARCGEPKFVWEPARFPQAFHLARAAALFPEHTGRYRQAFEEQVRGFLQACPYPLGIHHASSQEAALRLAAWVFALAVFHRLGEPVEDLARAVAGAAWTTGHLLEHDLAYAQRAVYNNHLISEALGLYLSAWVLPERPQTARWRSLGLAILTAQADRQVYPEGASINQSHTYQRAVVQEYLLASALRRAEGAPVPAPWTALLTRSYRFLRAQQEDRSGWLPNHGSNDGSLPRVLSVCPYEDFRPLLTAVGWSLGYAPAFDPGPWDEEALWLGLEPPPGGAPREPARGTVSLDGYHVLRDSNKFNSFTVLRDGNTPDRFTQIDTFQVSVFHEGEEVLTDPGSYLYADASWHEHFLGAASHNTLTVDGAGPMVHHRQFKVLYRPRARVLARCDHGALQGVSCEHDGFRRLPGGMLHRRAVFQYRGDTWLIADRLLGGGSHRSRLHWLGTPGVWCFDASRCALTWQKAAGDRTLTVTDGGGRALVGDVVAGRESPPRGWLSRRFGSKVAAPSLAVEQRGTLPHTYVSVLTAGAGAARGGDGRWTFGDGGPSLDLEEYL
jgi:asparagine synthase (glutamine-hydrolysing)